MNGNSIEESRPLVSVIMNCYNSEKYLKEAIDSVYAQTYTNWEIIFWDNNSNDNSAEIASSYDDSLKYFKAEKTIPLCHARNAALERCNGEFIAFLDCDDIWLFDKLEKQIPLFNNKEVGLVYGDSLFFNESGVVKRNLEKRRAYTGQAFQEILKDYMLDIETVVVRASLVKKHNIIFNNKLTIIQDAEFFLRICYFSKIDYISDVVAKWRVHNDSLSKKRHYDMLEEMDLMYMSLNDSFPTLDREYRKSFLVAKSNLVISKAIYYWRIDEKNKMRTWLKASPVFRIKVLVLYLCSFFKYQFIARAVNK